jgi:hypothetical protein
MDKPTKVMLRLETIQFQDAPRVWWKKTSYLGQALECIRQSGLWLDFAYYGEDGSKRLKSFRSAEQLADAAKSWDPGMYVVQKEQTGDGTCKLTLVLRPGGLGLRLLLSGPDLDALRETAIDQFIDLTSCLHKAFADFALFGPRLGVEILDFPFPRVRPQRRKPPWTFGNAVDFITKKHHESSSAVKPEDVERLLKAPMPAGTRRLVKGGLVILRWVDNLNDGKDVAERRSLQEQWFVNVLNAPVDSDRNEHGDYLEAPLSKQKKPPLTFYDPTYEAGYKAVTLDRSSGVDEELFDEMATWVQSRQLPDRTPLRELHLILPDRESALRVRDRATKIGVDNVYYTDDEGGLWNPFPPGE